MNTHRAALNIIGTALASYIENCSGEGSTETVQIEKAWSVIQDSEKQNSLEKLSLFICEDKEVYKDNEAALELLNAQAKIDGSVIADNIVMMCQKFEFTFTVDELLSEIGL